MKMKCCNKKKWNIFRKFLYAKPTKTITTNEKSWIYAQFFFLRLLYNTNTEKSQVATYDIHCFNMKQSCEKEIKCISKFLYAKQTKTKWLRTKNAESKHKYFFFSGFYTTQIQRRVKWQQRTYIVLIWLKVARKK